MVCSACSTASSRSCTIMFGFITKLYEPPVPDSRLKRVSISMRRLAEGGVLGLRHAVDLEPGRVDRERR